MACPLKYYKQRLADFREHPNLVKAWVRAIMKWERAHPDARSISRYKDGYERFVRDLFYIRQEDFENAVHGMVEVDCKQMLEDFFHIRFNEDLMK